MSWTDKTWGKVRDIEDYHNRFENRPKKKRTLLHINRGSCSSLHYHNTWNEFMMVEGSVNIIYMFGDQVHGITLVQGGMCTIPAFIPHQFQVITSGILVEMYGNDNPSIFRMTKGKSDVHITIGVYECL